MPNVIGSIESWTLGGGEHAEAVIELYPHRAALAFNIALATFAQSSMESGDECNFNDERQHLAVWHRRKPRDKLPR